MGAAGVPVRSVEQRELTQWFFTITKYADDLLAALETLDRWPEKVRLMQANWIGRSEGLLVRFALDDDGKRTEAREIDVYTTRPDTLFGAKFMAISPEHPLARDLAEHDPALAEFIADCQRRGTSEAAIEMGEKRGYDTGLRALHPFDSNWTAAGLCRQFRADGIRHRRDLRLPGARPARLGFFQQIRARQHSGRLPAGCRSARIRHHRYRV